MAYDSSCMKIEAMLLVTWENVYNTRLSFFLIFLLPAADDEEIKMSDIRSKNMKVLTRGRLILLSLCVLQMGSCEENLSCGNKRVFGNSYIVKI